MGLIRDEMTENKQANQTHQEAGLDAGTILFCWFQKANTFS